MAPVRRYAVYWHSYAGVGFDAYQNEVERWNSPQKRMIFGINLPDSTEPLGDGRNRMVVDRILLVPPNFSCQEKDRVELTDEPTILYEVIGVQASAHRNPFGWNPGGTVMIRRVDG